MSGDGLGGREATQHERHVMAEAQRELEDRDLAAFRGAVPLGTRSDRNLPLGEAPDVMPPLPSKRGMTLEEVKAGFEKTANRLGITSAQLLASTAAYTERRGALPQDSAERKTYPMCAGLLDYFPDALAEVARGSYVGNEKHNPGEPLHHARGKSMDHADCIVRHLAARGTWDEVATKDGRTFRVRHSAWVAWRALALLQEELEREGAPLARGARLTGVAK